MVDNNFMLNLHFGGGQEKRKNKLLKKEIAHLKSISDITDRVSGSTDVYYETFDEINEHSIGKIDLAMSEIENNIVTDAQLFKIGQEVTIFNKSTLTKEVRVITNINDTEFTFNEPLTIEEGFICRSMSKIIDGDLHLYPEEFLEHDIRLNLEVKNEGKKVRYIRNVLGGIDYKHWVEIQALDLKGNNVALNKPVTSNFTPQNVSDRPLSMVTDGDHTSEHNYTDCLLPGEKYVEVDLGESIELQSITMWHYYLDNRTYTDNILQVSEDGVVYETVFSSFVEGAYKETAQGKTISFIEDDLKKINNVVSWVEQEACMSLTNYEVVVTEPQTVTPVNNLKIALEFRKCKLTWDALVDTKGVNRIEIYSSTTGFIQTPIGGENLKSTITDLTKREFSDTSSENNEFDTTFYYSVFVIGDDESYAGAFESFFKTDGVSPKITRFEVTEEEYDYVNDKVFIHLGLEASDTNGLGEIRVEMIDTTNNKNTIIYEGEYITSIKTPDSIFCSRAYKFQVYVKDVSGNSMVKSVNYTTMENYRSKYYGFYIECSKSDPYASVRGTGGLYPDTYRKADSTSLNDCANMFPFNEIKPCIMKNGEVLEYLDPDNYTKTIDQSPSKINEEGVQVMIEIPKIYVFCHKIDNPSSSLHKAVYIKVAPEKLHEHFEAFAHTYNGVEKDKIYISAYPSGGDNGLVHKTGAKPFLSTFDDFKAKYESLGEGYGMMNYSTYTLLQILFLLAYSNRNCQKALGRGLCNGGDLVPSGETNERGFIYGDPDNKQKHVKFLGIENLWGSIRHYIDGLQINENGEISVDVSNKGNYEILTRTQLQGIGKIADTLGQNKIPFLPTVEDNFITDEDYDNHFSDAFEINHIPNGICTTISSASDDLEGGIFGLVLGVDKTNTSKVGSRLMFVPK